MIQNLKNKDIGKNHLPPAYLNMLFFKLTTLQSRINHTYGLFIFGKMVLHFVLIKYVWFIYFWKIGLKYELLSTYELLKDSHSQGC